MENIVINPHRALNLNNCAIYFYFLKDKKKETELGKELQKMSFFNSTHILFTKGAASSEIYTHNKIVMVGMDWTFILLQRTRKCFKLTMNYEL